MSGGGPQIDHSSDPDERPAAGDLGVWHRIREHKIIQWALGYLAAALALTHAEELIARAFEWPEFVSRALIVVLALGLPIAITLAWYHGHRASRHVSGAEASILAVLLLIGSGLLWALVRPHEPALTQSVAERAAAPTTSPVPQAAVPVTPASTAAALVPPPASGKPRIAILPFENLSPDPANAFFTEGLHDEIISTLSSRAPDLEVISRTTMMTYRTGKSVEQIARELGATHVLEGSVFREGNTVRLTLRLINAKNDRDVWSPPEYNRTLKSALTLESEVANEVASQLAVQLASGANAFRPITRDPEAYDLYLKERLDQAASIRGTLTPLEALQRMEGLLDRALARDPNFAAAYARRSGIRFLRFTYNFETDPSALRGMKEDLDAAERLAPDDPDVLFFKGLYIVYVERDLNAGLSALDAADAAGFADAGLLAAQSEVLTMAGRIEEAIQRAEHARTLDPKNQTVSLELLIALMTARRPAEALRAYDFAMDEVPSFMPPSLPINLRALIVWNFTGSESALRAIVNRPALEEITPASDILTVGQPLAALRVQHRYQDMLDYLARSHAYTIRADMSLGSYPLAEMRGWTHLLLGNAGAAAQDGREMLDFLAHQKETKWNIAFLHGLGAEAALFTGARQQAVQRARDTLGLLQWPRDKWIVSPMVAAVYAWAGAEDEATAILERLSTELPVTLPPAAIARDPLYTVPLAGNARYQALRAKLEAQMAATKLE